MKIQYASDLHLEFSDNYSYLKRNPLKPVGDILVLAGDIGYLNDDNYGKHPFWDWASENYKQVIVAIGNHELYKYYDLANMPHGLVCSIRDNVKCYYDAVGIRDTQNGRYNCRYVFFPNYKLKKMYDKMNAKCSQNTVPINNIIGQHTCYGQYRHNKKLFCNNDRKIPCVNIHKFIHTLCYPWKSPIKIGTVLIHPFLNHDYFFKFMYHENDGKKK